MEIEVELLKMEQILITYAVLINILTFFLFAADKWKAVHGRWRIREATLLGFSLIGGALGGLLSMGLFHHKTRKKRFTLTLPVMLILQILAVGYLYTVMR